MSDVEWVRDPALIELLAHMETFREGDEIVVQRAVDYSIPHECDGKAFKLVRPDNLVFRHEMYRSWTLEEMKEKETKRRALREKEKPVPPELESWGTVPVGKFKDNEDGYEWYVVWQNIAAWRRP